MAAVTKVKARNCTPVGYEVNDVCVLSEAVTAGDLLVFTGAITNGMPVMSKAPTTVTEAHGIATKDGFAGQQGFDFGIQGEMDGFANLTPGAPLYPSGSVAGGIDTTAPTYYTAATTPAVNVPATPRIRAISASRIRFSFV